MGRSDAVTVTGVAGSTALAAAIPDLTGVVIIIGDELGAWGRLELVEIGGHD